MLVFSKDLPFADEIHQPGGACVFGALASRVFQRVTFAYTLPVVRMLLARRKTGSECAPFLARSFSLKVENLVQGERRIWEALPFGSGSPLTLRCTERYLETENPVRVYCFERLIIHWPAAMPEPNPRTKKAILAANETSFHITTEKTAAKTRNMIDIPRKAFFDFMRSLLFGLIHDGSILD